MCWPLKRRRRNRRLRRGTIKKREEMLLLQKRLLLPLALRLLNALWSIALPFMMRHEKKCSFWLYVELHILASFLEDPSGMILLWTPPQGMCMTFNYHESCEVCIIKFSSESLKLSFVKSKLDRIKWTNEFNMIYVPCQVHPPPMKL